MEGGAASRGCNGGLRAGDEALRSTHDEPQSTLAVSRSRGRFPRGLAKGSGQSAPLLLAPRPRPKCRGRPASRPARLQSLLAALRVDRLRRHARRSAAVVPCGHARRGPDGQALGDDPGGVLPASAEVRDPAERPHGGEPGHRRPPPRMGARARLEPPPRPARQVPRHVTGGVRAGQPLSRPGGARTRGSGGRIWRRDGPAGERPEQPCRPVHQDQRAVVPATSAWRSRGHWQVHDREVREPRFTKIISLDQTGRCRVPRKTGCPDWSCRRGDRGLFRRPPISRR